MVHTQPRCAVIIQHADLRVDHTLERDRTRGRKVRDIAQVVDYARYQHEEDHAKAACDQYPFERKILRGAHTRFLAIVQFGVLHIQAAGHIAHPILPGDGHEEQQCQSYRGIQPDPLAGDGQAHEQAA